MSISYDIESQIAAELIAIAGSEDHLAEIVADCVRGAINYILDGRSSISNLEPTEKTHFGVAFQRRLCRGLNLPEKEGAFNPFGLKQDTRVLSYDVDVKTTMHSAWMIPMECLGYHVIGLIYDHDTRLYSLSVIHANPAYMRPSKNGDRKRQFRTEAQRTHAVPVLTNRPF